MYGINLQLFNSKLKISIFTICLKSYILRKTCGFAQKNCAKLKFRFMRNISQKIFPVLRKMRKKNSAKPRKTHCVSCAKIAQKFAKKNCAKIAQILRKRFSLHFVETLFLRFTNFSKAFRRLRNPK